MGGRWTAKTSKLTSQISDLVAVGHVTLALEPLRY